MYFTSLLDNFFSPRRIPKPNSLLRKVNSMYKKDQNIYLKKKKKVMYINGYLKLYSIDK